MTFTKHAPIAAALATYLILGSLLCIQVPLWIPPDEELHVAYCQYIARNSALPRTAISSQKDPVIMAFHPPLYYSAGSLFFSKESERVENLVRIDDGPGYALIGGGTENSAFTSSVYRLRFFTLLCGAIIIVAAYAALRMLFPLTVLPAAIAAFFIAVNPQFVHVAAGISNEIPAAALCSLFLVMLLGYCRQSLNVGAVIIMGVALGLSLLTKTSTLFLVPLCLLAVPFSRRQSLVRIMRDLTLVVGSATLVSGWWYALNWRMLRGLQTSQPWFNRGTPISFEYCADIASTTFISFFGFFGSQQIALPLPYLIFYALLIAAGLYGFLQAIIRTKKSRRSIAPVLVLVLAFAGGATVFALLNYTYYAPQGKYLYTVIVPVAALVGGGILALFNPRSKAIAAVVLICAMSIFCVTALFSVFLPAVQKPRVRLIAAQQDFDCITPHITIAQPYSFLIEPAGNNLCGIRILFSKTCETSAGSVIFRLVQHNAGDTEVCRTVVPLSDVRDTHWHYFSFTPITESEGKNFLVHFEVQGIDPEARLALWCAQQATIEHRPGGAHKTATGCAPRFEAYAHTGTVPESVWEGREQAAIRQQMYISVREMQFFTQCAPDSVNRKYISRKWQRLERAAMNRQKDCLKLTDERHQP